MKKSQTTTLPMDVSDPKLRTIMRQFSLFGETIGRAARERPNIFCTLEHTTERSENNERLIINATVEYAPVNAKPAIALKKVIVSIIRLPGLDDRIPTTIVELDRDELKKIERLMRDKHFDYMDF